MQALRILSLWLPNWAICRALSRDKVVDVGPIVLVQTGPGGQRLSAVNQAAVDLGLGPDMSLADARALVPDLIVRPADPRADAADLARLADWALRYTPFVALDGPDGLMLDITGAAHLFGPLRKAKRGQTIEDEAALADDLTRRLAARGIDSRIAIGPTPASAAALARYGPAGSIIGPDRQELARVMCDLPLGGLRLDGSILNAWRRLGLRVIGDIADLTRPALARRYGGAALMRLDEVLGLTSTPLSPLRPAPHFHTRMVLGEPISTTAAITQGMTRLAHSLADLLASEKRGARQLELALFRVDGAVSRIRVATVRPVREADHFIRLFGEKLDRAGSDLDVGFGFDALALYAVASEALADHQPELRSANPARAALAGTRVHGVDDLGALVDRLGNRLGLSRIGRLVPQARHIPEAAVRFESLAQTGLMETPVHQDWRADERDRLPRPLRLLGAPEPIDVMADVPDGPPVRFRWRRVDYRISLSEGPERIAPEWWQGQPGASPAPTRDYFRVEDQDGHRFWLYRDGLYSETGQPRWYLHGVFA